VSTRLRLQADLRSVHPAGRGQLAATLGQPPSRLSVIGERPQAGHRIGDGPGCLYSREDRGSNCRVGHRVGA